MTAPPYGERMKTWFITGSSSGFGRSIAEDVIARGDRLVATARDPKTLADLVARVPDRVVCESEF